MKRRTIKTGDGLPNAWMPTSVQVAVTEDEAVEFFREKYKTEPKLMIVLEQHQGDVIYLYE